MHKTRIPTAILVALAASLTAAVAIRTKPDVTPSAQPVAADTGPAAASRAPAPNSPPTSHPVTGEATDGSLTMTAELSHYVTSTNQQKAWVLVSLDAAKVDGTERPPLDVALVIDRSSSMRRNDKIGQAKRAALELLSKMGPEDRVSVVSFDSAAEEHVGLTTSTNADVVADAINSLQASGGTSIWDGYQAGLSTLMHAHEGASRVMFLLSDGQGRRTAADLGELAAGGLRDHGTTITTLGIGDGFNEQTLGGMAMRGGGKFHYVESADTLRQQLNAEWDGLATAAARRVQLRLKANAGVRVAGVLGYQGVEEIGGYTVMLDSIFSQRSRQIIVELDLDPDRPNYSTFEVELSYDDVSRQPAIPVSSGTVLPLRTVNRATERNEESGVVLSRVRRVKTALATDEADKLLLEVRRAEAGDVIERAELDNRRFIARHGETDELRKAASDLQRSRQALSEPIQEKRQIRLRKKRKEQSIEIISGDRR